MPDEFHLMPDKFHFMSDKFHLMPDPTTTTKPSNSALPLLAE
jgi:hypothetical protein